MDFETCKKAFEDYVSNYDKKEENIALKYYHSYAVSELMAELAFRLKLSEEELAVAKIIGLLHDIGRFEQWKKYHSFSDTNVDHAEESCTYLFEEGHIRDFVPSDKYDFIIEQAIRYHNKLSFPKMNKKEELFTKMIRDMDKVDIYKQMAIHSNQVFDCEKISKEALENFKEERLLKKVRDKKYESDKILVQLAFLFDINFNESFDILVETDNFDLYLSTIEVMENSEKLWRKLREICFDKINRGVTK